MQFVVAIKFVLFALSNLGVWELLRRHTRLCALSGFDDYFNEKDIGLYFLPSLTIAIETTFLFIGGLLNILRETAFLIYLAGLILFIYYVVRERGVNILRNYMRHGFAFLVIACAVLLICVNGQKFFHYDNFSHWALVVKQMLMTNRYPNFWDQTIMFQEYPLGSSSYIYFFSLLVSKSESMWMFAQDYIIIAAITPLLAFAKNNRIFSFAFVLLVTNFILVFNISYFDLLVDTLLPVVSMCGLMFLVLYSSKIQAQRSEAYLSIFYFVQILQIKNSGIFFALIASMWLLFGIHGKESLRDRVLIAVAPYISFVLWHRHCKYVFVYAAESKHAMTPEALRSGFMSHPPEVIKELCRLMTEYTLTDVPSKCVIICMLAFGILVFVFATKYKHFFIKLLIFNFAMYVFYQFGLLLMYIFSMEGEYALELPGVDRYSQTILVAIMYSVAVFGLIVISELKFKRAWHCAAGAMLLAGVIFSSNPSLLPVPNVVSLAINQKERTDTETRTHIENLKEKYSLMNYENGVVLCEGEYDFLVAKYLIEGKGKYIDDFMNITEEELETLSVQYVLNFDSENPAIQAWIEENYPEQLGNEVIFLNAVG